MEQADLCYFYDCLYVGQNFNIFHAIKKKNITNEMIAFMCRYACEYYLKWSKEDVCEKFSDEIINRMKLREMVELFDLPNYVPKSDFMNYLLHSMYPDEKELGTKEGYIIQCYERVMLGDEPVYPRGFMTGGKESDQNASVCLLYALLVLQKCKNKVECARFMFTPQASAFLHDAKLHNVMKRSYGSPQMFIKCAIKYYPQVARYVRTEKQKEIENKKRKRKKLVNALSEDNI